MASVLISGGNGLVGRHLRDLLKAKGYEVFILSRNSSKNSIFKTYLWNPEKNEIDPEAILAADYIIHLAGENITEKRWSAKQKQKIIDSRIKSAQVIFDKTEELKKPLKAYISASAIGYYGAITSEKVFTETDLPGNDFLAVTCQLWEKSADQFTTLNIRTVKIRTGLVIDKSGGIIPKLVLPVKLFLAAPFGNGKQYMPWIHITDLCGIYLKAIEDNEMHGAYNAVSPQTITNKEFLNELYFVLKRRLILPNLPAIFLKLIFGEMAIIFLTGSKVSPDKIIKKGYQFKFSTMKQALANLF
jgi:hypothetical protein